MAEITVRCPKCGEPARIAIVTKARVRCQINADGKLGKVLSASVEEGTSFSYECGGGHTWSNQV